MSEFADIKRTWSERRYDQGRAGWDFKKNGPLRIPIRHPMPAELQITPHDEPEMIRIESVLYRLEYGQIDGRPAERIVGRIEGADFEDVVETRFA